MKLDPALLQFANARSVFVPQILEERENFSLANRLQNTRTLSIYMVGVAVILLVIIIILLMV